MKFEIETTDRVLVQGEAALYKDEFGDLRLFIYGPQTILPSGYTFYSAINIVEKKPDHVFSPERTKKAQ